ncbi:MAG: exo-alpha-sialidase [Desulfamplus sp.]|nr:exo-alpha-sialidase [Desulfamplus sp.]
MYPFFMQILLAPVVNGGRPSLYAVSMDRRFTDNECRNLQPFNPALVFESLDNGHSWQNVGEVAFQPDKAADPVWQKKMGFSEPWLGFAPDGSMLCFLRSWYTTPGPLYLSHSTDRGRTWSKPKVFDDHGCKPKMITLKNGVTVATYGRPGVSITLSRDSAAKQWDKPIVIIPASKDYMNDTCGYAHLCPLGDNEFM